MTGAEVLLPGEPPLKRFVYILIAHVLSFRPVLHCERSGLRTNSIDLGIEKFITSERNGPSDLKEVRSVVVYDVYFNSFSVDGKICFTNFPLVLKGTEGRH